VVVPCTGAQIKVTMAKHEGAAKTLCALRGAPCFSKMLLASVSASNASLQTAKARLVGVVTRMTAGGTAAQHAGEQLCK